LTKDRFLTDARMFVVKLPAEFCALVLSPLSVLIVGVPASCLGFLPDSKCYQDQHQNNGGY